MKGFVGLIVGFAVWTAFVWAVGGFITWDAQWYWMMAQWNPFVRFFVLIPFVVIGCVVAIIGACIMED